MVHFYTFVFLLLRNKILHLVFLLCLDTFIKKYPVSADNFVLFHSHGDY